LKPTHTHSAQPDASKRDAGNRCATDDWWTKAEQLIDRLDDASRQVESIEQFPMQWVQQLQSFTGASGVCLRIRETDDVALIAKTGLCVIHQDDSGDVALPELNQNRRWLLTRPFTSTSEIEVELYFEAFPTQSTDDVFRQTTLSLIDVILPILLRRKIDSLSNQLDDPNPTTEIVESFYRGASANQQLQSIARSLATITQTDRVSIVLSTKWRPDFSKCPVSPNQSDQFQTIPIRTTGVNRGRLVATSVPSAIDSRAQQAIELARIVHDDQQRSHYARQYGVESLHVEPITGNDVCADASDHETQTIAWVVFETFPSSGEKNRTSTVPQSPQEALAFHEALAPYRDITHRSVRSAIARKATETPKVAELATSFSWQNWTKVVLALTTVFCLLCVVKVPLKLSVPGQVVAASKTTLHSPVQGFVSKVLVPDGQQVNAGTALLKIQSPALELDFQRLSGDLASTETKIQTLQSMKRDSASAGRAVQTSADLEVLKVEAEGFREQLRLIQQQQERLVMKARQTGLVRHWDSSESLAGCVVVPGQPLLQIIDPAAGWEIELAIPDKHIGYVLHHPVGQRACKYRLTSSATETYHGQINGIESAAVLNEHGESVVHATVSVDLQNVEAFRRGASVVAKVDCGNRPAAFVLLRGLVEWWRTQVWV
jgi:multidrug resistance efflux pump